MWGWWDLRPLRLRSPPGGADLLYCPKAFYLPVLLCAIYISTMCCCCFLICFDHFHAHSNGPHVLCLHPPLTEVLGVGPGPVLLFRHWPVAAWVAGATNVLHLPFLLHGLTDACDVTCKLRIGANCVWKERTDTTVSF